MAKKVTLTDGRIVKFPSEADDAAIRSYLVENFPNNIPPEVVQAHNRDTGQQAMHTMATQNVDEGNYKGAPITGADVKKGALKTGGGIVSGLANTIPGVAGIRRSIGKISHGDFTPPTFQEQLEDTPILGQAIGYGKGLVRGEKKAAQQIKEGDTARGAVTGLAALDPFSQGVNDINEAVDTGHPGEAIGGGGVQVASLAAPAVLPKVAKVAGRTSRAIGEGASNMGRGLNTASDAVGIVSPRLGFALRTGGRALEGTGKLLGRNPNAMTPPEPTGIPINARLRPIGTPQETTFGGELTPEEIDTATLRNPSGSVEGALGTKVPEIGGSVEGSLKNTPNLRNARMAEIARADAARARAVGANEYQVGSINHLADTIEGMPGNLEIGEQLRGVKGIGQGGIDRVTNMLGDFEKYPDLDPAAAYSIGRASRSLASRPTQTIEQPIENPIKTTPPDQIEGALRSSLSQKNIKTGSPGRLLKLMGADPESISATDAQHGRYQNPEEMNNLVEAYRRGDPIDPVSITVDKSGNIIGADGRHRALAALNAGVDEIPYTTKVKR